MQIYRIWFTALQVTPQSAPMMARMPVGNLTGHAIEVSVRLRFSSSADLLAIICLCGVIATLQRIVIACFCLAQQACGCCHHSNQQTFDPSLISSFACCYSRYFPICTCKGHVHDTQVKLHLMRCVEVPAVILASWPADLTAAYFFYVLARLH